MANPDFTGVGGSYVVDPTTGALTLVERTEDPNDTVITRPLELEAPANAVAVTSPDHSGED